MRNRAKIFHSFDSLKGYMDYIRMKEKVVVEKIELSEDELYDLNQKIQLIRKGEIVTIVYYREEEYIQLTGMIAKIDLEYGKFIQIVNEKIDINNILKINPDI